MKSLKEHWKIFHQKKGGEGKNGIRLKSDRNKANYPDQNNLYETTLAVTHHLFQNADQFQKCQVCIDHTGMSLLLDVKTS